LIKFNYKKQFALLAGSVFTLGCFMSCQSAPKSSINPVEYINTVPSVVVSSSDTATGFANVTLQSENAVTVTNKAEFLEALAQGGLIYVDGMIDLSEGYMPSVAGGSTEKLDALVAANSDFANYAEYKAAYVGSCTAATNDKSSKDPKSEYGATMWALNNAYKKIIRPTILSNTTIIGISEGSGFKGGTFIISKVENVVFRNLVIQDAYDPFPHHEENDGFNSQHDNICIQDGSHNIWIDHCTFYDTLGIEKVTIADGSEEKYQTYDGLLDMKSKGTTDITVSYCKFYNHDKTMLIGSSDTELKDGNRSVTLHHNLFINCGQRLPMVRQTNLHAYNNVYLSSDPVYASQYAVGVRNEAMILSENNYFGEGISFSYSGTDGSKKGSLFATGDVDNSVNGRKPGNFNELSEKPFTPEYKYTLDSSKNVFSVVTQNAGAGKVTIK